MGCLFSQPEQEPTPQFSWDKRRQEDPSKYRCTNISNETKVWNMGSLSGKPFAIDGCSDAGLYLFDNLVTITIDNCENCDIFIGPVQTSIFLRNCKNCRVIAACQQLRTRDCFDIDMCLFCHSLPIIESSEKMVFRCFRGSYFGLAGQMTASSLEISNNFWWRIHDFTPDTESANFQLELESPTWLASFYQRATDVQPNVKVSIEPSDLIIPISTGKVPDVSQGCFVVLSDLSEKMIQKLHRNLAQKNVVLCQEKSGQLSPNQLERLFGDTNASNIPSGVIQGLLLTHQSNVESLTSSALSECGLSERSALIVGPSSISVSQSFFTEVDQMRKV